MARHIGGLWGMRVFGTVQGGTGGCIGLIRETSEQQAGLRAGEICEEREIA